MGSSPLEILHQADIRYVRNATAISDRRLRAPPAPLLKCKPQRPWLRDNRPHRPPCPCFAEPLSAVGCAILTVSPCKQARSARFKSTIKTGGRLFNRLIPSRP